VLGMDIVSNRMMLIARAARCAPYCGWDQFAGIEVARCPRPWRLASIDGRVDRHASAQKVRFAHTSFCTRTRTGSRLHDIGEVEQVVIRRQQREHRAARGNAVDDPAQLAMTIGVPEIVNGLPGRRL